VTSTTEARSQAWTWTYSGQCPNCGHSITVELPALSVEAGGLDGERLRLALEAVSYRDMRYTDVRKQAHRIAAEYARLASDSTPEQP
jgi:hypothetical protein